MYDSEIVIIDFRVYICINPNCDSYLDEVNVPIEIEWPLCPDCSVEMDEEY